MPIKLLIIDDHPLFREGISSALKASGRDVQIAQASDAHEGIALAEAQGDFDAVLLDLALPGMNGLVAIREFRLRCPFLPVVIVSALDSAPNARRALSAGAAGFIPKSVPTEVVLEALREILAGGVYLPSYLSGGSSPIEGDRTPSSATEGTGAPDPGLLTVRQIEVLTSLCRGKGNKEIASDFGLSVKTVKTHVSAIFRVLGVVNRTQAVLAARRMGLLAG